MGGLKRFSLVVHGWGGAGLVFAQRFPERIEKLVLFTNLPLLLPGYRGHPRRADGAHPWSAS